MPHLYLSFLPSHHYVAIGQSVPEGSIQSGRCSSLVLGLPRFLIHRNLAVDGTAEFHGSPSEVVGKEPEVMPLVRAAETSMCPMLSLFVLLILLLVGTLGTEPLHFFWWCSH